MTFSENRFPLFGIMLQGECAADQAREPGLSGDLQAARKAGPV